MQLFYISDISSETDLIHFSKEESKHIIKVLRKLQGDVLHLTNGKGDVFQVEITIPDQKKCIAKIISHTHNTSRNYSLHIAVAPTKMNDRFEWFLEKATEIGIESITPIICDHSERKVIKAERFEKIIQSAMKQSLQCFLPKLNPMTSFSEFVKSNTSEQKFIAHCAEDQKQDLKKVLKKDSNVIILIGPEGDFSVKEIEMALQHNYIPVTLGKTRLRTETAAIVACHTVALLNE
ncbi:MAG: 16S rRNA (uracil(1498)-N(3))-methyltransferase [Bacteroidia bacterium]|nr:16S rRNA (uracil(1498)-N(3))-methyltransferase [Bacteroidia bacterium]NND25834.1 16S rRNA (uracil(1498)-N(3))-methyltransferase [Flavobacteriaceae bacterium]NNK60162.1 16S rRNA (uracil(1498)-N(3))-methyltransferase [Flavobacteriaceae bacterium]NNL33248.1 16S rRNA (uracil(1498)-N(3))-methyltransferase [Flavobacteriaceae bacterium]RZW46255.1 MAG: 16S rRNA (uracil(1498)-N(3))-methyltransferase [Flavobacteriaceae bacterium]